MKFQRLYFLILALGPLAGMAQGSYEVGLLPSVNINKKLPKDWSLNFKGESRQAFFREGRKEYEYILTDFALVGGKKVSVNTTLALGYLLRFRGGKVINRSIQQVSTVRRYSGFKLGHRISSDQTFEPDSPTEVRLRYRLSSELPLNGDVLDPKEFFLKLSNEYLGEWQGIGYDLEIRGGAFIGYFANSKSKLEIGLDYRLDSFIEGSSPRQSFWTGLNLYWSF